MIINPHGGLSQEEGIKAGTKRVDALFTRLFVVFRFRYLRNQEILTSPSARLYSQVGRGRI